MPHTNQVSIPGGFNPNPSPLLTGAAPPPGPFTGQEAFNQAISARNPPRFTQGQVSPFTGAPPTGLLGFEQALQGGLVGSEQALTGGLAGADLALRGGLQQTLGELDRGFGQARGDIQAGNIGQQQQSALAGLLGPEAQAQAFQAFQDSPEQAFLREQGQRAVLNASSAIGGLGGGNVRRELVGFGTGLAATNLGESFQRGQQALGSQQFGAQNLANLASQGGLAGAGFISGAAGNLAQARLGTGQQLSQGRLGIGRDVGQARFGTGQQLAQAAGGTTAALANLQNQLGIGQAGVFGQGTTNLANLLSGTGLASSQLQQQLGTILANIGTGTASTLVGPTTLAGQFDAAGQLGQNTAVQNALQQLLQLQQSGQFNSGVPINQQLANQSGTITPA